MSDSFLHEKAFILDPGTQAKLQHPPTTRHLARSHIFGHRTGAAEERTLFVIFPFHRGRLALDLACARCHGYVKAESMTKRYGAFCSMSFPGTGCQTLLNVLLSLLCCCNQLQIRVRENERTREREREKPIQILSAATQD